MDDWKIAIHFLEDIVRDLDPHRSAADRAGIYGGATAVLAQLREMVLNDYNSDAYALEKISKARWSIAAGLNIDYGNGHDVSQHRSWALGSLGSLKNQLKIIDDGRGGRHG